MEFIAAYGADQVKSCSSVSLMLNPSRPVQSASTVWSYLPALDISGSPSRKMGRIKNKMYFRESGWHWIVSIHQKCL